MYNGNEAGKFSLLFSNPDEIFLIYLFLNSFKLFILLNNKFRLVSDYFFKYLLI